MKSEMRVFSLGYQGMTLDRYVDILKTHGISVVVDVRETPWSYKPGFSKKPLSEGLQAHGIAYVHVKSAGNPAANRKMGLPQTEVIKRYKRHLNQNPACLEDIYQLVRTQARTGAICLLCYEERPHDCHRKVILDKLAQEKDGLLIHHLAPTPLNSEKQVASSRVPKSNNRERLGKHVEVAKDEGGFVFA